jgi:phosphoribosylglycinamide formyltransferase 1
MKNIAVLASGGGSNLQALIDAIESGYIKNAKIKCVISNNKNAYALERAKKHKIETVFLDKSEKSREEYTDLIINELVKRNIDLVCLAGFMIVLSSQIISKFKNKIINIHPALLPNFGGHGMYGHHVHEAVIKSKVKTTGATVHFVDEGCDTGQIIIQESVEVSDNDTPSSIAKKVLEIEHKIYPLAVKLFIDDKIKIIDGKTVITN